MSKKYKSLEVSTFKNLADREFEQVEPLIDHFLPGTGVFLFCGSAKIGKSWLALQIGLHICSGEKLWGYDVRKKEVLYLCLEDGENRLQDRMYSAAQEYSELFHYAVEAGTIGKGLVEQLKEQIATFPDIGLIIIDTLAAVRCEQTVSTNNAYLADYNTISVLHKLAMESHITVLIVHHVRKMKSTDPFDDISGTNGLFGSADGAFVFRRDDYDSEEVKLYSRCRDLEERVLTIKFDNTNYHWDLVKENTPVEDAFATDEDLKKVVEYVDAHGSFEGSATELCNLIHATKKPQSISGKLNNRKGRLLKMGIIFTREHTRDGSHITLTKTDQQPKEQYGPDDLPYEVLDDDGFDFEPEGEEKAVTSSQSSQPITDLRRNVS